MNQQVYLSFLIFYLSKFKIYEFALITSRKNGNKTGPGYRKRCRKKPDTLNYEVDSPFRIGKNEENLLL